jgi:NADH-quinone oxidoreductase E subunit
MPAGDFATAGAHASGHFTVTQESKAPYPDDVLARLHADADAVIARYPQPRSALLPLLHLVQSVDGYVSGRGIAFCAERLDLETAEVSGVATFYTQYKRHPNGEYTVGVCTNTLCAIMGGDAIWEAVSDHLGVGHDETTPDGKITLERVECNAACDYAPVVMANWEFFDNQTIESTTRLVDDLREGKAVRPTRGADTGRDVQGGLARPRRVPRRPRERGGRRRRRVPRRPAPRAPPRLDGPGIGRLGRRGAPAGDVRHGLRCRRHHARPRPGAGRLRTPDGVH